MNYPGVNAHLNSLLQTPGTPDQPAIWPTFHAEHIVTIAHQLNRDLPPNYVARPEQSIQVRGSDWGGEIVLNRPRPDVTIFDRGSGVTGVTQPGPTPTWEATITEIIEPTRPPNAVVIRETSSDPRLGTVVTRIELLSPANKPGGGSAENYRLKRIEAIRSGIPLIEIDYLHESPPPIRDLPVYPTDADAYPYYVAVTDPRQHTVRAYGFRVDQPATSFPVPLAGDEQIVFDLNAAYQETFTNGRWSAILDTTRLPVRFETYRADDQQRIREYMR